MYLTQEKKDEIFSQFGKDKNDTGSAEGQIALFTPHQPPYRALKKKPQNLTRSVL